MKIQENKTILVTGAAGFIGFHLTRKLLDRGNTVIGIDNLSPYYSVKLKKARLRLLKHNNFKFYKTNITAVNSLKRILRRNKIDQICHLAAQAGVRYSITNPYIYETANNQGTLNMLEMARHFGIKDFIYASSSSVYGGNKKIPFSIKDNVNLPVSVYAATKRYNELLAHSYSHLYGINTTGLRFFTVYGPWGRPDMALYIFTNNIISGKPIAVYNYGKMRRDFTYVTDIVDGVVTALDTPFKYKIFNLGNSESVQLDYFISCIEKELGIRAKKKLLPLQPGDVPDTCADIKESTKLLKFRPKVKIEEGVKNFVAWYKRYHKV